jgi:thiamine biosynthesis protein ThiS
VIEVNGKQMDFVENETIKDLLKRMKYTFPLIVVKMNNELIPRDKYHETLVKDESKISVIHMISGG